MTEPKRPVGRPPNQETVIARKAIEEHRQAQEQPTLMTRVLTTIKNRYDASGMGRRMAGWRPRTTSPNTALQGLQTIRDRARDSSRNDPAAAAGIQKWTTTLIGIGITPRFRRIKSKTRRQEIVDLYNDFVQMADADGVLNLYGMQTLGIRTWFDGGECFIRKRRRFNDEGLPVPLQVQLLEPDMVPLLDADSYQGLPVGNRIRSGIELNNRGKRVAYWVYKQHPGDNATSFGADDLVRVAASEMSHIFEPKRPGQLRGVSELVSVLTNLRNMTDYKDNVLERQKLANLFVAFITRKLPQLAPGDIGAGTDPIGGRPLVAGEPAPLVPLQPGLFQELDDGQDVTFSNPPEAGTTYSDYIRTQGLDTASGAGLPYEMHSGDIINVSDRTLRIVMNEFRRLAEQRQWQVVIPMMCQPVIDWFVEAAVLAGKISLEESDDARRVEHAPHGWPDIHPTQDIQGRIEAMNAGLRSRSGIISASGDDPDTVDDERAADKAREDKLGLTPVVVDPSAAPAPAPAPAPTAPAPTALERALEIRHQAEAEYARAATSRLQAPAPEPVVAPVNEAAIEQAAATLALTQAMAARAGEAVPPANISLAPQIIMPAPTPEPVAVVVPPVAQRKVVVRNDKGLMTEVHVFENNTLVKKVIVARDENDLFTEFKEELIS